MKDIKRRTINYILSLLPLLPVFLSLFAMAYQSHSQVLARDALFQEKLLDRKFDIDIICDQLDEFINIDSDWGEYDYETILSRSIAMIDEQPFTYAGIFNTQLEDVSIRTPSYSTSFEPLIYDDVLNAVLSSESGTVLIPFKPEGEPEREMSLYFRWAPTDPELDGRFLLVVAISQYSVSNQLTSWIPWGTFPLTIAVTIGGIWVAIRAIRLGEVWNMRPERGEGKWRKAI